MLTFGQWMRKTRLSKRLTTTVCAERAGMPVPVWSNWENDRSRRKDGTPSQPRRDTVASIASALDVPISEVLQVAFGDDKCLQQSDEWSQILERVPPSRRAGLIKAVNMIADTLAA